MCEEVIDIAVIGAGVTGCAVARELALAGHDVVLLEREQRWGMGVSGRNSEVLHAGIYYPEGSLKARLCVAGNRLARAYCAERGIAMSDRGKLIVGWEPDHLNGLENIQKNARKNGVDLTLCTQSEVVALEPHIHALAALYSPSSAVFDAGGFVHALYRDFEASGGMGFMGVTVSGIVKSGGGWEISGSEADGEPFVIFAGAVVNAAGLYADRVAAMAGVPVAELGLALHFSKGDYFTLAPEKGRLVSRPVYPLPEPDNLGIHITPDVAGSVKLGPDAYYIERKEEYRVDAARAVAFYEAVKPFFPALEVTDLSPAMSGIRPKLQGPGEPFRDFHLKEDLPGFFDCIGIESPGLTSALALAQYVRSLM